MSRLRDLLIKRRSEVTPLIHWDFSGKSNADAGTIVEDLTGNGYDLELKNFALDNVSGYNGYPTDFRKWAKAGGTIYDDSIVSIYENKIVFDGAISDDYIGTAVILQGTELSKLGSLETLLIKVNGLKENQQLRVINQTPVPNTFVNIGNGISFIDVKDYDNPDAPYPSVYIVYNSKLNNGDKILNNVTIEIFPLYPDQLVFNGIDNFCQCTKDFVLPISRGYSWIAKYKILDTKVFLVGKGTGANNNIISVLKQSTVFAIYSYGTNSAISQEPFYNNEISYGTSRFAGKQNITKGTVDDNINNKLVLGTLRPNEPLRFFNGTISEFYLFDRDLTQSQIEKFISDNMIPLPEVYYDVEKQGTLNEHQTKDKLIDFSGNENHGTLHNFTFDESDGWGYIPNKSFLDLYNKSATSSIGTATFDGKIIHCTKVIAHAAGGVIIDGNTNNPVEDVSECKIKVTGMSNTGISISIGYTNLIRNSEDQIIEGTFTNETFIDINKDGEYVIPAYTSSVKEGIEGTPFNYPLRIFWTNALDTNIDCDITIEFLPTDEDCLRFKGTSKTYADINTLTEGFKTIFMVFNPAAMGQVIYDQRMPEALNAGRNKFAIYGENKSIAWNARNTGGVTYINGELNTTELSSSLIDQKHCATLVNDTIEDGDTTTPIIGDRIDQVNDGQYAATMKLYKFLGFKEALSEKQIQMVIEKYRLQVD